MESVHFQNKHLFSFLINNYIFIFTLAIFGLTILNENITTGQPRYVKLAYLEYMAYVEVIVLSRAFPLYCFVFQTCLCRN